MRPRSSKRSLVVGPRRQKSTASTSKGIKAVRFNTPHQLAWKNMYLTAEGQQKGAAWARKAIWGNVPSDLKNKIKGGLEALTSGQFIALWTKRGDHFMARKVKPPAHYVQTAKKPTQLAVTARRRRRRSLRPTKRKRRSRQRRGEHRDCVRLTHASSPLALASANSSAW